MLSSSSLDTLKDQAPVVQVPGDCHVTALSFNDVGPRLASGHQNGYVQVSNCAVHTDATFIDRYAWRSGISQLRTFIGSRRYSPGTPTASISRILARS